MFYEDLSNIELVRLGGLVVYIADFISLLIFICFLRFLQLRNKPRGSIMTASYLLLGWICVGVLIGATRYGFRAIGEVRTMVNYFAFFVPFVLKYPEGKDADTAIYDSFRNTIFVAAIGTLIIFGIEIVIGGRFFISAKMNAVAGGLEDFRGIRILNSDHAFTLSSLAVLVLVAYALDYRRSMELLLAGFLLFVLVLYSKNRTAAISIMAAFGIWMIIRGYFKLMLGVLLGVSLIGLTLFLFSPAMAKPILDAFSGVANVSEDGTGQFRLLVQAAAIQQGLAHPVLGEGFGGYFNYYIPALDITYDVPPHSMYVYLFQKTGIVGTIIAFYTVVAVSVFLYKADKKADRWEARKKVYMNLLFIVVLAQVFYGFAYNFSMFSGLYLGYAAVITLNRKTNKLVSSYDSAGN